MLSVYPLIQPHAPTSKTRKTIYVSLSRCQPTRYSLVITNNPPKTFYVLLEKPQAHPLQPLLGYITMIRQFVSLLLPANLLQLSSISSTLVSPAVAISTSTMTKTCISGSSGVVVPSHELNKRSGAARSRT